MRLAELLGSFLEGVHARGVRGYERADQLNVAPLGVADARLQPAVNVALVDDRVERKKITAHIRAAVDAIIPSSSRGRNPREQR